MDLYVGQKFKHHMHKVDDGILITLYQIHAIKENQVALEVLESDSRFKPEGKLVSIAETTVFYMLENGAFELVNEDFEIET